MITDSISLCVRSMSDASYCSLENALLETDEPHFFPSTRCEWEWSQTLEKRLGHVFVRTHLAIALDPAGPVSLRWPDLRMYWYYQCCDGLTGLQSERSKEESLLDLLHCLQCGYSFADFHVLPSFDIRYWLQHQPVHWEYTSVSSTTVHHISLQLSLSILSAVGIDWPRLGHFSGRPNTST